MALRKRRKRADSEGGSGGSAEPNVEGAGATPAEEPAARDESADPKVSFAEQQKLADTAEPSEAQVGDDAGEAIPVNDIEVLADELEVVRDRHLRLAAEFDNFRKRTIRERAAHAEKAQAELVKELLESLDDLTRVLEMGSTAQDTASLLKGVELVEKKLRRALEHSGLKQIETVGQPFDPELHEALAVTPADKPQEDGVIAEELAKGYLFRDTLLKPALVNVKKFQPKTEGAEEGDSADSENDS